MRVFVTGATGWIGSAVVEDLLSSGHEVTGLTTTAQGARKLQAAGAKPRVGREIASLIAARLKIPALGIPAARAGKHFGILGNFVGVDNPASSQWTRDGLAWRPAQPGLLADMDAHYFQSAALTAAA